MANRSRTGITMGTLGSALVTLLGGWLWLQADGTQALAGGIWPWNNRGWAFIGRENRCGPQAMSGTWYRYPPCTQDGHDGAGCGPGELGGTWMWMRSPDQEKVVVAGLFNRYCIRCHGVDGRGVWDIPGVPDFTNVRWQATRSDAQIARIIIEGRGAVMPPFRGTLSFEEACAMARYLRTFVPGTEVARPDLGAAEKAGTKAPIELPMPQKAK